MSNDRQTIRLTVDEIEVDQDGHEIAVLITDAGEQVTAPCTLLPQPASVGSVLTVSFKPEPDVTDSRRSRITDLQRRLFGDT